MSLNLTTLADQRFYVVGLGLSGRSTAAALMDAGAQVTVWDDKAVPAKWQELAVSPQDLDYSTIDTLVLSPGIPLTHPEPHVAVRRANQAGVEIIGDVELAFRAGIRAKTIGITGTNGKSTTTALVDHILRALGKSCEIGGNFGLPLLDLNDPGADGFVVLELSSYQLDLSDGYPLDVAVLLNISPDHLERHGGEIGYAQAKARIFNRAKVGFVTGQDSASLGIAARAQAHLIEQGSLDAFADTPFLRGEHNLQNQAAAFALCKALGFADADIMAAIQTFEGVAHRQELIGQTNAWTFVNDSKATNVDSAVRALNAFSNIHWLAGGQGKAGGLEGLVPGLSNVTKAYAFGENRQEIADFCAANDVQHSIFDTLDQAIAAAMDEDGGTLLLSPAAASWDQYKSFEARGDHFRSLVAPYLANQEHAA